MNENFGANRQGMILWLLLNFWREVTGFNHNILQNARPMRKPRKWESVSSIYSYIQVEYYTLSVIIMINFNNISVTLKDTIINKWFIRRMVMLTWQSLLQYHWLPQPAQTNWAIFWLHPWHWGTSSPASELLSDSLFSSLFPSSIINLSLLSSFLSSSWKQNSH